MKVMNILGVAFKQVFTSADFFHFPNIDESLNGCSLEIVILESHPSPGFVAGFEPIIQQSAGCVGNAFASASLPRFDRLPQRRNASARAQLGRDVEEARLIVGHGFLASWHDLREFPPHGLQQHANTITRPSSAHTASGSPSASLRAGFRLRGPLRFANQPTPLRMTVITFT